MLVRERQYIKFLIELGVKYYPAHTCGCGCNGLIEVKRHHLDYKIPIYIKGHYMLGRKLPDHSKRMKGKNNPMYGKKRPDVSKRLKGKKRLDLSEKFKGKNNPMYGKIGYWKDKKRPNMIGKLNPAWKGGHIDRYPRRLQPDYIKWRKEVYKRDNYTCYMCGDDNGGNLNAHHILKVADWPQWELELWNGITLCKECHKNIHFHEYKYVLDFLVYTG